MIIAETKPPADDANLMEAMVRPLVVVKNIAALTLSQMLVIAASILSGILVARSLGSAGYGAYSLAFAFVGLFGLLFSLGVDTMVVREVAREPDQIWKAGGPALWLRFVTYPLTLIVIVVAAFVAGYQVNMVRLMVVAAVGVGLSTASDLGRSIYQGLQRMELDTLTRALEKTAVLALLLYIIVVRNDRSVERALWAFNAGAAIALLVTWGLIIAVRGRPTQCAPRPAWRLLLYAAPLAGSMVVLSWVAPLPTVMLSRSYSLRDVGLFTAANNIVAPFSLLAVAFAGALLPVLTNLFGSQDERGASLNGLLMRYLLMATALLATVVYNLAPQLLVLLYGPPYEPAAEALQVLAFSISLFWLTTYLNGVLIAAGQHRHLLGVGLLNLLVTAAAGALLIPFAGIKGAALMRTVGLVPTAGLMLYLSRRWLDRKSSAKLLYSLLACFVMLALSWVLRFQPWPIRISLLLGTYCIGLWFGGLLRPSGFSNIRRWLHG
jgi:polysaccharide transporter, PST family